MLTLPLYKDNDNLITLDALYDQGVVDADAALTAGARHLADITAERGTLTGRWKFVAICRARVV